MSSFLPFFLFLLLCLKRGRKFWIPIRLLLGLRLDFEVLVNEMRGSWSTSPEWAKSDSLSFINRWSHKRLQLRPASGQIRAAFPQLKDDTRSAVAVPDAFRKVFHKAECTVAEYTRADRPESNSRVDCRPRPKVHHDAWAFFGC